MFGKGVLYSLNVDFKLKSSTAIGLGGALYPPENYILHSSYYYLIGEKNKRFEIGGGFTYEGGAEGTGVILHGVIGYRYQKKNGNLFRIGFTPFTFKEDGIWYLFPWVGISLGYSF